MSPRPLQTKFRLNLTDLVSLLRKSPGIEDLSLTTNGLLLEDLAGPLKESGLDRVTISLDSLQPDRFRQITRTGDLAKVLRGLDRCEAVGLHNLKINCVTMRGTNDDEFPDFARLTLTRNLTIRFIEYMPLGDAALGVTGGPPVSSAFSSSLQPNPQIDPSEIGPAAG